MPLYEFACGRHITEAVRPMGTEFIKCPTCDHNAWRTHRPTHFQVVGPTVDTRGMFRRYTEATQEIDHAATTVEANTGEAAPAMPMWTAAQARAAAFAHAGEEFRPLVK